jgi:hypothetical protein
VQPRSHPVRIVYLSKAKHETRPTRLSIRLLALLFFLRRIRKFVWALGDGAALACTSNKIPGTSRLDAPF